MIDVRHLMLAAAAVTLIAVVAVQDILVPALRQKTISAGLTGPYHVFLDVAFLVLAVPLAWAFWQHDGAGWIALGAAAMLILTGITGTLTTWVDTFTNGQGELWHTRFTAVTFVLALVLELVSNHGAPMWCLTVSGLLAPLLTHYLVANASVTEKAGVLQLCIWLVAWSL